MGKYQVWLAPERRAKLQRFVSAENEAPRIQTRARILLLADTAQGVERSDATIAAAVGAGLRTVARIRKRFITDGIKVAIFGKRPPPRPEKIKITGKAEQELLRLVHSVPPKGLPWWTLKLLADKLVALGLVKSISTETVRRAMKRLAIDPWSCQYGPSSHNTVLRHR